MERGRAISTNGSLERDTEEHDRQVITFCNVPPIKIGNLELHIFSSCSTESKMYLFTLLKIQHFKLTCQIHWHPAAFHFYTMEALPEKLKKHTTLM